MLLDLGGIAKGYAADEGSVVLQKYGVTRALVAAGGDIAVSDAPPNAAGWKIAIAPLKEEADKEQPHLVMHNAAVSTSGDAYQYVEINGKRSRTLSIRKRASVWRAHERDRRPRPRRHRGQSYQDHRGAWP